MNVGKLGRELGDRSNKGDLGHLLFLQERQEGGRFKVEGLGSDLGIENWIFCVLGLKK